MGDFSDGETTLTFSPADGLVHVFRDRCSDGLIVRGSRSGGWDLVIEEHTQIAVDRWVMVAATDPACVGVYDPGRDQWVARDVATGRVIARDRDVITTIGRAARHYLTAARERRRHPR